MRSSAALLALALLGACAGTRYATLVYVWLRSAPVGTVLVSPYSERVRLLVSKAESSASANGSMCGAT